MSYSCSLCSQRLSCAPSGFKSSGALCCVIFSFACHRKQPCKSSGCARGSTSAVFTFSDGSAVPSSSGAHFVSDPPLPSHRCWQASSHRGLWVRPFGPYSTGHPTTSLHRAKIAPASERPAFSGCAQALHRPSSYCADPIRHRCGDTCSALTWCHPSRGTSS